MRNQARTRKVANLSELMSFGIFQKLMVTSKSITTNRKLSRYFRIYGPMKNKTFLSYLCYCERGLLGESGTSNRENLGPGPALKDNIPTRFVVISKLIWCFSGLDDRVAMEECHVEG